MTKEDSLLFATIEELSALLVKRKVSPVELTEQFLRRIEKYNPQLNAFLPVTDYHALAAPRRAEKEFLRRRGSSGSRSTLLGIPISLKDNIWTRGIRTTAGSKVLRDFVPTEDATVVRKLYRAGAILLGKTNLHEFAYGITTNNVHYGATHNPWALDRIPGGSSGGSAAGIAAGLSVASIGTDTGGSIRIPAAMCGIVGLKPTFGRVSVFGTVALAPSFDHVGPLAHSVTDAAILLGLIAGRDPLDPTSSAHRVEDFSAALRKPLRKFRLGGARDYFWEKLDGEVRAAAEAAVRDLEKHGATVSDVSLPHLSESPDAATNIALAETRYGHEAAGYFPLHADEYSDDVRQRVEAGRKVLATEYIAALDLQKRLRAEFDAAFQDVHAIIAPTASTTAPPIRQMHVEINCEQKPLPDPLCRKNRHAN